MTLPLKPVKKVYNDGPDHGILDKVGTRWVWLDHAIRAYQQYTSQRGDFYAAGITYFSIFALFPLLMVLAAILSYVMAGHPEIVDNIKNEITSSITGSIGEQLNKTLDQALSSRGSVGLVGLIGMFWTGLGWIANLRNALTVQWKSAPIKKNWFVAKFQDLTVFAAMLLGLGLVAGLTIVGSLGYWNRIIAWFIRITHISHVGFYTPLLHLITFIFTALGGWALWTLVIAKLPQIKLPFVRALKAGLMMTIAYNVFIQLLAYMVARLSRNPAWAVLSPILGILLFFFWLFRMLLYCTAWAATDPENEIYNTAPTPPSGMVLSPNITVIDEEQNFKNIVDETYHTLRSKFSHRDPT